MGKAHKRINPKIKNKVNRRIKELALAKIIEAVSLLSEPWAAKPLGTVGRPSYPSRAMAAICIYQEEFCLTCDDMESELRSVPAIAKMLELKSLPRHTAINDARKKLNESYIMAVNSYIVSEYSPSIIAVDSSGFSLRNSSAWYDIRIGRENEKKDFLKLHAVENLENGLIQSYRITDGKAHDCPLFKRLISGFEEIYIAVGDRGYLSMENCKLVVSKGGVPFFMPKSNSTARARHPRAWKNMIREFMNNLEEWLKKYHMRSVIEALFSSVKKRLKSYLRAVKKRTQRKELSLKVVAYNVRQVLYIQAAEYLNLPLWVKA